MTGRARQGEKNGMQAGGRAGERAEGQAGRATAAPPGKMLAARVRGCAQACPAGWQASANARRTEANKSHRKKATVCRGLALLRAHRCCRACARLSTFFAPGFAREERKAMEKNCCPRKDFCPMTI